MDGHRPGSRDLSDDRLFELADERGRHDPQTDRRQVDPPVSDQEKDGGDWNSRPLRQIRFRDGRRPCDVCSGSRQCCDGSRRDERRTAQALELVGQLSNALESRVLIEQAKGVIAERYSMSQPDAFTWLRSLARNER
ncbi:MAG: ANTAR domain-containing protein, partial [Actinobacteria bacterium]|nr:ANTAR domain-containing protein [Actinomycetota bacterium]